MTRAAEELETHLAGSPYQSYTYAYPHKLAYRALPTPRPLREVWAEEDRSALFLYIHIPFCEMRCGFCNLFTTVKPGDDQVSAYMEALGRQARVVREALGAGARFARFAVGGGTPSYLSAAQLRWMLDLVEGELGADLHAIPCSFEVSPETIDEEKLALLRSRGIDRVSMGVQSFIPEEVEAIYRRQDVARVEQVLGWMNAEGFPTVNVDLMYGLPGQTAATWAASLDAALRFTPAEVYLYPLYVRPLTRMGLSDAEWDDQRLGLYRQGRDHLLAAGYRQVSMRMFRRIAAGEVEGPVYRCQEDGMVGLGCGARSYTRDLHYSSAYAVGPMKVKEIIHNYIATPDARFAEASWGFALDAQEQRRRYAILSLLSDEGLSLAQWADRFGGEDARGVLPELGALVAAELAAWDADGARVRLTPRGVERSDALGPWLYSAAVQARIQEAEVR